MSEPAQVLIVDDDKDIHELVCRYLVDFGFGVHGEAMRTAMAGNRFDIIILDLMLPGEDGLSLCRHLRATTDIPIIMFTARSESIDRVAGLELGADDYITKPFDLRELVTRIHTVLRRANGDRQTDHNGREMGEQLAFEGWKLDRTMRQLTSPQ